MRGKEGPDDLAEQFRRFAVGAGRDGAARYARICDGVASDEALLELVAGAPPDQRRPNILLAAVHFLLLSGVDDPLAACYPTVLTWRDQDPATARQTGAADLFPLFAAFCARHRPAVAQLVATRATQTNEVGRCTAIFPALSAVASRVQKPIAVVDLGAAAGLNLLFDRYAYDYGNGLVGDAASPLVLRCGVRDGGPHDPRPPAASTPASSGPSTSAPRTSLPTAMPTAMPAVAARIGIDRRPIDVRDDDQALWLLACQWPDHLDRFETASRALALARSVPDPPIVQRGDVVGDLASVVASLPADAHACLLHSWVAAYLTPREQRALADAVSRVASTRPVSWIFAEAPYEVPGLPMPPPPGEKVRGATAVVLVDQAPGLEPAARRLADMHPHGRWLHWYGTGG